MATKTNQPNREELLQLAEDAAKNGQKDGARVMFRQVLSQDKRNERALMWLARLAKTPKERKQWLERVVSYYPENKAAQTALSKLNRNEAATNNKTLVLFGAVAAVLIIVLVVVLVFIVPNL